MMIHDLMSRNVECVNPETSLAEAAARMRDLDIGSLPVGESDRFVGMLTDRDIAIRAVAEGCNPKTTRVSEMMTPGVISCYEDQDVTDAAGIMKEKKVRRLIVLNRDKRIVGICSLGDLGQETIIAGDVLQEISHPGVERSSK